MSFILMEHGRTTLIMELQSETGHIALVYSAKSVNMVAGGKGEVTISEDGSTLVGKYRGADLSERGKFTTDGQRLYNLSIHDDYGAHSICLISKKKDSKPTLHIWLDSD